MITETLHWLPIEQEYIRVDLGKIELLVSSWN